MTLKALEKIATAVGDRIVRMPREGRPGYVLRDADNLDVVWSPTLEGIAETLAGRLYRAHKDDTQGLHYTPDGNPKPAPREHRRRRSQ